MRYKRNRGWTWTWTKRLDMNIDKEGATLEKRDGSKFLDKRSTQVGGASS